MISACEKSGRVELAWMSYMGTPHKRPRPSTLDDSAAVKSIIRDVGGPLLLLLLIVLVRPRSNLVSTSNFRRRRMRERGRAATLARMNGANTWRHKRKMSKNGEEQEEGTK